MLTVLLGLTLIVTAVIGAETALGFAFDPRYRDFPFASLTMAVVPFAALDAAEPAEGGRPPDRRIRLCRRAGRRSALYRRSTRATQNWQAMWTCAIYLLLALTLWRARAVQIPE